jgi:hypothetical protein
MKQVLTEQYKAMCGHGGVSCCVLAMTVMYPVSHPWFVQPFYLQQKSFCLTIDHGFGVVYLITLSPKLSLDVAALVV